MSILVTGATGFLGQNLLNTVGLERAVFLSRKNIGNKKTMLVDDYNFENLIIPESIDEILLLGGVTPKGNEQNNDKKYLSNIISINNILKALDKKIVGG